MSARTAIINISDTSRAGRKRRRPWSPNGRVTTAAFSCLVLLSSQFTATMAGVRSGGTIPPSPDPCRPKKITNDSVDIRLDDDPMPPPTFRPTHYPTRAPHPLCNDPTHSPYPTFRPTERPSKIPTLLPTKPPTLFPTLRPSDRPSGKPTQGPTLSTQKPTGRPSQKPTQPPTPDPTPQPTSQPSQRPTPQPTAQSSQRPTLRRTPGPNIGPTALPTSTSTPAPTLVSEPPDTRITVSATPTPSIRNPTDAPTFFIFYPPTPEPAGAGPSIASPSSTPAPIMVFYQPTSKPSMSPAGSSTTGPITSVNVVNVTIPSFTLEFFSNRRRLWVRQGRALETTESLEELLDVLRAGLTGFLSRELVLALVGFGVTLLDIDLNVLPLEVANRQRSLQETYASFQVDGIAQFQSENAGLDSLLQDDVNTAVEGILTNKEDLLRYLQDNSESETIDGATSATATLSGANNVNGSTKSQEDSDKPSLVKIIIGFALVGVAVLSLFGYAYIFCRKWRKNRNKRKGEISVGSAKTRTNSLRSSAAASHRSSSRSRSPATRSVCSKRESDDSSESSDEDDLAPNQVEVNGELDDFARELAVAAMLDHQAYLEHLRSSNNKPDAGLQSSSKEQGLTPVEYKRSAAADTAGVGIYHKHVPHGEEFEITEGLALGMGMHPILEEDETTETSLSVQSRNRAGPFPYGYEGTSGRYDQQQLSTIQGQEYEDYGTGLSGKGPDFIYDDGDWIDKDPSDPMLSSKASSNSEMESSLEEKNQAPPVVKSAVTPSADESTLITSASIKSATMPPAKNAASTPSPTNVRRSLDEAFAGMAPPSRASDDGGSHLSDSLKSPDIVQEVQRLTSFVKQYEKNRERMEQRASEWKKLNHSSETSPSMHTFGYDVLSDGTSQSTSRGTLDNTSFDTSMSNSLPSYQKLSSPEPRSNEKPPKVPNRSYDSASQATTEIKRNTARGSTIFHSWSTDSQTHESSFVERETENFFSSKASEQSQRVVLRDTIDKEKEQRITLKRPEETKTETSFRGSEGSDDSRLGITPFGLQKLLDFQGGETRESSSDSRRSTATPKQSIQTQSIRNRPPAVTPSPPEPTDSATPKASVSRDYDRSLVSPSMLDSLRSNEAMLDQDNLELEEAGSSDVSTGEFNPRYRSPPNPEPPLSRANLVRSGTAEERRKQFSRKLASQKQIRRPRGKQPDSKIQGMMSVFDASVPGPPNDPSPTSAAKLRDMISLFESRAARPIVPPSESWQYNS